MAIYKTAQLDAVFHALSDATRRAMLVMLATSERTAGELGAPFDIAQPLLFKAHCGTGTRGAG